MATRMQQRRGTAAQWVSTNGGDGPILEAGEIGFETDTGKFKIGDGANHWVDLDYFLDESDIDGITGDYVLANTLGQANGVATLDSSGKLTGSQIPGIDELAQDAVDLALVAGTGISKTYNDGANTITIAVDTSVIATKAELAEVSQDSINDALTAGTGIAKSYNDNANTITISTSNIPNASLANSEVTINGFSISLGGSATYSSDNIGEGTTNLYFTNARSRATVSGGTGLDYNASTGVFDIDSTVTTNTGSQTLTNKSIDLANNTVTGTVAQFNSALSDANFVTTSDTGTVTSTMIANGTIVDGDINASAAIAQSKIANLTTDLGNKQDKVSGVSDTEIGYLDGVTSNVQAQLNSKAALAGATFTGNVVVQQDFQVDGNFTVNGSNVLVSATQIQIEDSIVQLAHQNPANTVDLGIVAGYNDGSAKHAGLVKDTSDAKWKLFKGVTDEPTTTVNFAQATLDDLAVGALEATSLSVGTVSNTEIGYLDGVTSNVQAQLDAKAPINNASFTGTFSAPSGTITSTMIADETIVNADIANTAAIALSKLATDPLARANHTGTQTASTISDFNEAAQDAVGGILGSGLTYTDASNTITVDSSVVQLRVANVTDTEIGYLDGVTSAIQTQLDNKASLTGTETLTNKTISSPTISSPIIVANPSLQGETTSAPTFVSISQSSTTAASSTDGITWTVRTLPTDSSWDSVTYGNNTFVSVSYSTTAASSADGITWTVRTLPASADWRSVTFGNNTFVVVAYDSANAASSTDGITWTLRTMPANNYWRSVTFGNNTFVSVAGFSSAAASSTDGITWTLGTLPLESVWFSVAFGNNTFVATSFTSAAASSTDGITWTLRTMPVSGSWRSVTFGNNTFVAVARISTNAATSTDGITWTVRTLPASAEWRSVTFGNNTFVVVAYNSTTAASSTDGITWTLRTMPSSNSWNSVAYGIASSTTPVTLSINGSTGTNGQVLQSTGTGIQWGTVAGYSAPTLGSTSIASGATVTTIAGLTLTAPTLTGTVNASGDINLSAVNGPGSLVDELALLMMGAL